MSESIISVLLFSLVPFGRTFGLVGRIEHDVAFGAMDTLTAQLSSLGLLGFDLVSNTHFYRRLPFKIARILSLNPRLKNARKLVVDNDVQVTK